MSAWSSSLIAVLIACLPLNAVAAVKHRVAAQHAVAMPATESDQLRGIVSNLLQDNADFVKSHNAAYYKPLIAGQMPRATVVTCSDSRVHTQAFDKTPDGDLFMVRNIGNQLTTAEGSVEYGVHHLHTPLLIFVGHSACGAINAASGNYAKESSAIRRELKSIRIAKGVANADGVRINVNNQVAAALKKFAHEVKRGDLTVIGAVYDFANDFGQGFGKLNVINLNGETDGARINGSKLITGTAMKENPSAGKNQLTGGGDAPRQPKAVNAGPGAYSYP
ncbi:MAG: carbonic anhydrase [Sulfuricella sp.]